MAYRPNLVRSDPRVIASLPTPLLIDEWQLVPSTWDAVRREVDRDRTPGRFILTGSATPSKGARVHSGAGRIAKLVMRPMTLPERGVVRPTVSLLDLLAGSKPSLSGHRPMALSHYCDEILASGLPGIRLDPPALRTRQLDSYITNALEVDIPEIGTDVRHPNRLRSWLTAYAAATSTTANYTTILDAATPEDANKLSRSTTLVYREILQRIRLLDPLPAWVATLAPLKRLISQPKHHLVDPALAARLLGATQRSLLEDTRPIALPRSGTFLGSLFESLVTMSVRVFAQSAGAAVSHLRTWNSDHEVDLIVEREDLSVLAIEVKLSGAIAPGDTKHLNWLEHQIGDRLIDKVIINTGSFAHRLPDGTAVVPLALLGP